MATLLVVDDDNNVRDTLCEFFSASHQCHSADRAEQALAFLEFENYDVSLLTSRCPASTVNNCSNACNKPTPILP